MSLFPRELSEYEKKVANLINNRTFGGFEEVRKTNEKEILNEYGASIQKIIDLFDAQSILIERYRGFFNRFSRTIEFDIEQLLVAAITRNIHQLYISIKLTIQGDFGVVKASTRQIFELLLLAKYCALEEDLKLAEKWNKGGNFNLYKTVIKPLKSPKNDNLLDFWNLLCTFNHGTIYASQNLPYWKECERDIETCLAFTYIMISCNYHLFNTVLLGRNTFMKNLVEYNFKETVSTLRKDFNDKKKDYSKEVGVQTRRVVYDYCRKWNY